MKGLWESLRLAWCGRVLCYRLEGHTPVPERDAVALERWKIGTPYEARVVGKETVDETEVSTMFLEVDIQSHPYGLPLVFETCLLSGPWQGHRWLYTTWEEAEAGHARVVAALRAGEPPPP